MERAWVGPAQRRVLLVEAVSVGPRPQDADGRALLAEGLAMRDALAALIRGWASCTALEVAHGPIDGPLAAWLSGVAPRFDAVLAVAPESGGELAALQRAVASGPARWLGCDAAALALAGSKAACNAWLARAGIPVPATAPEAARRGWIVKPDDGAGSLATAWWPDLPAARQAAARRAACGVGMPCIEPWVEGESLSLSLLVTPGPGGRGSCVRLLGVNRQGLAQTGGDLAELALELDVLPHDDPRFSALAALGEQVVAALPGLAGWVGVDLVWSAQAGPVVIEVNPRPTTPLAGWAARAIEGGWADELACGVLAWPDAIEGRTHDAGRR